MRHVTRSLLTVLFLPALASAAPALPSAPASRFAPGEVIVAVAPATALEATADGRARALSTGLAATLTRFGLARADALRRSTPVASRRVELLRLRSDRPDFDPEAAAAELRGQPGVIAAAPNLHFRLALVPNDTYFASDEWWLSNSAAGIHAQQGWNRETGSAGVPIAILDTGVDLGHEDLAAKIWTNPGEIPGNGIDDDHDGYVDDVHGWDFGDGDNDPNPEPIFDPVFGIDEGWHGTYVSGLAAAASNNGVGVAGVAWGCPIMPLKVSDVNGMISLSSLVSAMDYAIAHQAAVINMSLGDTAAAAGAGLQPLINEAFNAGVVCVAAAGNDGTDTPTYPAACESVLAVASTNVSNVRSSWSNWGWYVDMCAPGEGMWGCIARNYTYDDNSLVYFEFLWGYDDVHPYMAGDGTSFAAPLVSGAAALMRSRSPGMSPALIMQQLIAQGDVKTYDNPIGPKLNLDRSLTYALAVGPPPARAGATELAPPAPNPAARSATFRFALARPGPARLAVYDAAGREVRVLAEGGRGAGEQSVTWDLRDAAGSPAPAGLFFARFEAGGRTLVRRLAVVR